MVPGPGLFAELDEEACRLPPLLTMASRAADAAVRAMSDKMIRRQAILLPGRKNRLAD
jgi:hypothetical protein